MNILIIGMQATGKSVLAQALKEYHEARKEDVVVYDDTTDATDSYTVGEARQKTAEAQLKSTKGKPKAHTLYVMQTGSEIRIDPKLVDYLYQTSKMR